MKTTGIDRYRPAQRHQRNRNHRRKPYRHEILMGFVHSDQEEHQRVRDEGSVFPKCLDGFLPPLGDRVERLEIAHDESCRDGRQDAGQAEMVRKEERAIGGDGRESNFNEMIVRSPSEQKRSKSDGPAAENAASDCPSETLW